jgi:hypothetical protein
MFLHKNRIVTGFRLAAVTLGATLAGCSLNPFSGDDEDSQPAPVAQTTAPDPGSVRTPATRQAAATSQPAMQRISEPVPLAEGHPDEYVVQVGDTLWDIAATFLKDPWYWPEIWYVNPEIENPHLIYPGDVLGLVYIDGMQRITNVRGSAYRLSPQARVTPLEEAIDTIPYEAISAFLSHGMVLEKRQAEALPYIVETRGEHLIASAGNQVYVRGMAGEALGGQFNVINIGDPLIDPDDNKVVGFQGNFVGEGLVRRGGDPATVALTDSTQEIYRGDRLIPAAIDLPLNFFPGAPRSVIDARIMSVIGGVTQIGQYQVVVLNRGSNHGVGVGDVLTVFQAGETVKDIVGGGKVKLPDEEAGTIMVFKVYDRISYALVMEAQEAIHILDAARNPR